MNLYDKKHFWVLGGFEYLHVDNVTANPGAAGAVFATDDIGSRANMLIEIAEVTATATAGVLVNLQGFVAAE